MEGLKKVVVLGSTGSIGTQALSVISDSPGRLQLLAISAESSTELLARQAAAFGVRYVGIAQEGKAGALRAQLPAGVELIQGAGANAALAALPEADIVLIGVSGFAGLPALLAALQAGKTVALANKESIVCGNRLVKDALKRYGGSILPVDSEHAAIFQCLQNGSRGEVAALHLTASGGPFWQKTQQELAAVTVEQALKHPVWRMGAKISIDSATLANKGLEVIEASYLFDTLEHNIFVLIHPQSIVHSMVEYCDGAVIAQLSAPDMRLAIQYALNYPRRETRQIARLSLAEIGALTFHSAEEFPAIRLARQALRGEDTLGIAYCIADEVAVAAFVEGRIGFLDILSTVEHTLARMEERSIRAEEDVYAAAQEAERIARAFIEGK